MPVSRVSQAHIHTVLGIFRSLQANGALEQADKPALNAVGEWLSSHLRDAQDRASVCTHNASDGRTCTVCSGDVVIEAFQEVYRSNNTVQRDLVLRKHSTAQRATADHEQYSSSQGTEGLEADPQIEDMLSKLSSFDEFDVFALDALSGGRALQLTSLRLLQQLGLVESLHLPLDKLRSFLQAIADAYKPNPYHCALHAADVVQTVAAVLLNDGFKHRLTRLELLSLVIAAVVHDVGHPGVSNEFLIRTAAEPAITYNDISVNENCHAALAFRILVKPHNDFLSHLSREDWGFVRSLIVDIVLATDMKAHHQLLDNFKADVKVFGPDLRCWGARPRTHALSLIMHCADVGNAIKPRPQAAEWARRVNREFWLEGEQQRRHGLEVSTLNDEALAKVPHSQAVFLQLYGKPCFDWLARIAPVSGAAAAAHLAANQAWWEQLVHAGFTRVPDDVYAPLPSAPAAGVGAAAAVATAAGPSGAHGPLAAPAPPAAPVAAARAAGCSSSVVASPA